MLINEMLGNPYTMYTQICHVAHLKYITNFSYTLVKLRNKRKYIYKCFCFLKVLITCLNINEEFVCFLTLYNL